jgi:Glycine zipper
MKKLLLSVTLGSLVIFSACSSKKEEPKRDMVLLNDAMYQSSMNTDTAVVAPEEFEDETEYVAPRKTQAKKSNTQRKKYIAPDNNRYEDNQTTVPPVVVNTPAPNTGTAPAPTAGTGTEATTGTASTEATPAEKAPEKKEGISKGAKGAIIGGVGGAVVGGILSKKGKGAVIGGVIGAAGGYILGRKKDRQDGRVNNITMDPNK